MKVLQSTFSDFVIYSSHCSRYFETLLQNLKNICPIKINRHTHLGITKSGLSNYFKALNPIQSLNQLPCQGGKKDKREERSCPQNKICMTYFFFFLNQNRISFVYPWKQTAVKALVTFSFVGPDNYAWVIFTENICAEICATEGIHKTSFPSQSPFLDRRFYILLHLTHKTSYFNP